MRLVYSQNKVKQASIPDSTTFLLNQNNSTKNMSESVYIKKYGSTSYLRIRQVENGRLYIRYRNNSRKNEAEELKNLQTTSLLF